MEAAARDLDWDGCFNVRDLGGFPAAGGRTTRRGAVVRSDAPSGLTEAGREALREHGIRTIVDLRDNVEHRAFQVRGVELLQPVMLDPIGGVPTVSVPVVDFGDAEFWDVWRDAHDPPGFYAAILERWQERFTDAVVAVARAEPGGVLVHCQVGRDRTGLVAALLLTVCGVAPEEIAADYALSAPRLRPLYDRLAAAAADDDERERLLRENASEAAWMLGVLGGLDVEAYLRAGGATGADLDAIRARLLEGRAALNMDCPR